MVDPPPTGVDELVWRVLRVAQMARALVVVSMRHDAPRELIGRPERFDLGRDGEVRVVLSVAEGTEQRVLVERISCARVVAEDEPVESAPTAVVVAEDPRLRAQLTAALEADGWRFSLALPTDVVSAAVAAPALLVLGASPRRADATLTIAYALRRQSELAATPLLVAAFAPLDVAPGVRRLSRVQVLVAPFEPTAVRRAAEDLGCEISRAN